MREVLQHREYRKAIWTEHEQILRAIVEHNADGASALARVHLQNAAVNVQVMLPSQRPLNAGERPTVRAKRS